MQTTLAQVIHQYAPRLGLDPRAVLAYALEESGGRWDAVGDHGTSFGPFQEHQGGALGSHTARWAESPAGIIAGMQMMARTPIRGKQGSDALRAIYAYFGKGSDNQAAFARALPYLNGGGGDAAAGGPTAAAPAATIDPQAATRATLPSLLGALQAPGGLTSNRLLGLLEQRRRVEAQTVTQAPVHDVAPGSKVAATTPLGAYPADFNGQRPKMVTGVHSPFSNLTFASHTDWVHVDNTLLDRMNILARRLGITIDVISGYRSPKYSAEVGGYANDPHSRGVAVDAWVGGVPIGDVPHAVQLMHELGLESGAQPGFYKGKSDPEHVQVPGSGVNKRIHAKRTHAPWR